jgi:hypothetical protein
MARKKIGKPELTFAGHVLGAISALVIFFSAVPVVMWGAKDNFVSKAASIAIVFIIGLAFFVVGAGVLRLFGVLVFKQSDDSR